MKNKAFDCTCKTKLKAGEARYIGPMDHDGIRYHHFNCPHCGTTFIQKEKLRFIPIKKQEVSIDHR